MPRELEKRGTKVDVVSTYRTVIPETSRVLAEKVFSAKKCPDWITFTSSSTVKNFANLVPIEQLKGVRIASIGPITSETIRQFGFDVDVESRKYTTDGLLQVLTEAVGK